MYAGHLSDSVVRCRVENIVYTLVPDWGAIHDTCAHRSLLVDPVQGKTLVAPRRTCHHLESQSARYYHS